MIRLTVLYNLPPGSDEAEFLQWRLGEYQDSNASMKGVIRTDFARIDGSYPKYLRPPYRFMTVVEWPHKESFEASFYSPEVQEKLKEDLKLIAEPLFLISEILTESTNSESSQE